ncbi:hypothetical protein [Legionella waltersii]|uniref:Coiled-coil protein n=1 Tax=Legionella waltersii TaxID=66969 RepID=A0A0W1A585_9GAMM|nr:hypothetical protein [Legionella waltersii]KTD76484.1 coiled-coil protein [Legionella waltersii]SNV14718.1 coiled-coil protein [Legionella waltersii]
MAYTKQNAAFQRDKQQFFQQLPENKKIDDQFDWVDARSETIGYSFLLRNHTALIEEFTQMWNVLQGESIEDREAFWFYSYYCASLLESFYLAYGQQGNATRYAKIKQDIKNKLNGLEPEDVPEPQFIESMYNAFIEGFSSLVKAPFHISQIRDYVAYSNLCRIYWAFCRLTLTSGLRLANSIGLISKLDAVLGTHTDVEKIIGVFEAPIGVINYFSVGFFLIRFAIDAGLLIKHTFFPNELEKGAASGCDISKLENLPGAATIEQYRNNYILVQSEHDDDPVLFYIPKVGQAQRLTLKDAAKFKRAMNEKMQNDLSIRLTAKEVKDLITQETDENHSPEVTTRWERFKHELYKRHCNFANDLVWATVNFLTNFNTLVGISGPAAIAITSVFLCFDVAMAFYKCHLAKKEYLTKRSQYEQEIADYMKPDNYNHLSEKQRLIHIDMLRKQLVELEISYKIKESTSYYSAAAAALLMIGFTAAMIFNPGLIAVAAFFVCTIAVGMYLSTGAYSKYAEMGLRLEQAEMTGKNLALTRKEYETARNEFIFAMVKNTVVPMVLIATFAICWPAAVVLTALYVGYEVYRAFSKHPGQQEAEQIALAAPEEEVDLQNHEKAPDWCFV